MAKPAKQYFTSLPLNDHCLNFRANSGNSHTSRKLVMKISASTRYNDQLWLVIQLGLLTTSEPQNSALAGVGTPMKEVVWRSSRLNFASLRAEKAAMMKATYGNQGRKGSRNSGYSITKSCENTMVAGATPKVTSSASESSSLPIGDETCSKRALMPSKKSKTAPMIIHNSAISGFPPKANDVAMQPEMRLQQVIVFGICFLILIFSYFSFAMIV